MLANLSLSACTCALVALLQPCYSPSCVTLLSVSNSCKFTCSRSGAYEAAAAVRLGLPNAQLSFPLPKTDTQAGTTAKHEDTTAPEPLPF